MSRPHTLYDALCIAHSALDILSRAADLHARQSFAAAARRVPRGGPVKYRNGDALEAQARPFAARQAPQSLNTTELKSKGVVNLTAGEPSKAMVEEMVAPVEIQRSVKPRVIITPELPHQTYKILSEESKVLAPEDASQPLASSVASSHDVPLKTLPSEPSPKHETLEPEPSEVSLGL